MKNTSPLPSLSFSLKSNSKPKPPRKPTMLHIKAIPDSNDVKVMAFDHDAVAFVFSFNGNLSLLGNENPDDFSHTNLILGGSHPDPVKLEPFDFAFNFISDADLCSRALDDAIRLVEENSIPCLNHPKLVKQMTRDGVYNHFNHIDGLLIPKTLRVAPHSMREVQELIEAGKIRLPLIIRPAGGHNGREMLLLESLEDIYKLECFAFDGRDYFLIEFHDYRSNDGLYRKYRMLWIDGKAYPRHLIIDDVWNIHGKNRYNIMEEHDHLRMEEIAYLENPVTALGVKRYNAITCFFEQAGLDFCGMDFSITESGNILVFEGNPAMYTSLTDLKEFYGKNEKFKTTTFDYQIPFWQEHEQAKIKMLRDMAARHS